MTKLTLAIDVAPPTHPLMTFTDTFISLMHSASQTELRCVFMFLKAISKGLDYMFSTCWSKLFVLCPCYVAALGDAPMLPWSDKQCNF